MNELAELIRCEIRKDGVISFQRLMEMALYEPGLGYYETHRDIGRSGDFYTSVSVGKLFGELLGFQFAQWLAPLKGEVQLLESGAHDGQLARDILDYLRDWQPEIYDQTTLVLLETSKIHSHHALPLIHLWQKQNHLFLLVLLIFLQLAPVY